MEISIGPIEKTLEMVRRLESDIKKHEVRSANPRCDKHGFGFNLDQRFSAWEGTVSLDSWTGDYGNSGCGTSVYVGDKDEFGKHFVAVLNEKRAEILKAVIARAKKAIKKQKETALQQIDDAKTRLLETIEGTDESA